MLWSTPDGFLASLQLVAVAFDLQLAGGDFTCFLQNLVEGTELGVFDSSPRLFERSPRSLGLVEAPAFVEGFVLPLRCSEGAPLLVEQNFCRFVFDSLQTRSHLTFSDESLVGRGEIDLDVEVHEVLALGHSFGLLEVRAVREAVNLVLRVLGVLRDSHRRVHLHLRCLQLVVDLVHMLFKPANFVASENILVKRKYEFGKLVLGLFL